MHPGGTGMIDVIYKKWGLKINSIWFSDDIDSIVKASKSDIIFIHGTSNHEYKNALITNQLSLYTDLTLSLDEIFKGFSKGYRNEINKSEKDDFQYAIYNSMDLKNNPYLLASFKKEYGNFTKLKGIKNTYNEAAMYKYIEEGKALITKVFKGEENLVQNIYVFDSEITRGLYTVSNFRLQNLDSHMVGRANRCINWWDIQYFKRQNLKLYDWGGINSKDKKNGVDLFKERFGGKEVSYYNVIIGKSFLGKLAVKLLKLKRG